MEDICGPKLGKDAQAGQAPEVVRQDPAELASEAVRMDSDIRAQQAPEVVRMDSERRARQAPGVVAMDPDVRAEMAPEVIGTAYGKQAQQPPLNPTTNSPFTLPISAWGLQSNLPVHSIKHPAAIPQIRPEATAPFLAATAPSLQAHGIQSDVWLSFLSTMSACVTTAKVSNHKANMAKDLGKGAFKFARAASGRIRDAGKRGDLARAGWAVVGAAVSIPVVTSLNLVGAGVALPFVALGAIGRKPQTPLERAAAYAAAANEEWLHPLGLHAQLQHSAQLCGALGLLAAALDDLTTEAQGPEERGRIVRAQLEVLGEYTSRIVVVDETTPLLELGTDTLWLVVARMDGTDIA
ncbi:Uu.00g123890.m01.CDS01 [Anthostomella pinea]|uniref:Uu.00g123890.m01.CDS01 n=1 Tax=Anthostomella pinea TaxID=933095 RepID=A0AAI8YHF9_9PEZI|nr:Uu.00g123890.m01.CDS01 [Anthostomella pinea]